MRSKALLTIGLAMLLCWSMPIASAAQAGASPEAMMKWNDIAKQNALIQADKPPFHLKVDFKLYDLNGKQPQDGTIEEWWTPDKGSRLQINSALEHTVYPGDNELQTDEARRENYLVLEMLGSFEHPMAFLRLDRPRNIFGVEHKDGQVRMLCYQSTPVTTKAPVLDGSFVCVDSVTNSVRQVPKAGETLARNNMAKFGGSTLPLNIKIGYNDVPSIEGTVTLIREFDPARAAVELREPGIAAVEEKNDAQSKPPATSEEPSSTTQVRAVSPAQSHRVQVSSDAMGGRLQKVVRADYPFAAREYKLAGTVLLHVTVSPQGRIESVFPIASPSPLFTDSAERAVKQWVYKPWEFNGAPVTIDTTVTISFRATS